MNLFAIVISCSKWCLFCCSSRTERWRSAMGRVRIGALREKKKKDWILVQFASFFSFTCLVLALLLVFCFLPRVLFGLVLLRGKRQVESTCVCLEDCKGIHCMCNKSSKTRDKGGRACSFTWWFCVFFSSLLLFHFLEGSWREWKKKVWNVLGRVLSCWY